MILSRKLRRKTVLINEPVENPYFQRMEVGTTITPTIAFRARASDGREYTVNLTDADIQALWFARQSTYGGLHYGWPPTMRN